MSGYDDIINLPHHQSQRRVHMSLHDRAAQFAPFAALKGYDEAVMEMARYTDERIVLDDNEIEKIDAKLQFIFENLDKNIHINLTYFEPDIRKAGGSYETKLGYILKIDHITGTIMMSDNSVIDVDRIVSLDFD